jgi:hypothetical protein
MFLKSALIWKTLFLFGSMLLFANCSSTRRVDLNDAETYSEQSGTYLIVTQDRERLAGHTLVVEKDSVTLDDSKVARSDVRKVTQKRFSPGKTIGLVAAITGGILLFVIQVAVASASNSSSSSN